MSAHTYLVAPGRWRAEGTLYVAGGDRFRYVGSALITEEERGALTARHRLDASGDGGPSLDATCRVWTDGARVRLLRQSPSGGELAGEALLADGSIVVVLRSLHDEGRLVRCEALVRLDGDRYRAVGSYSIDGAVSSAWEALLERLGAA